MALLVVLCLPLLLGLLALVLDLGRAYVIKAELQNAMDACALAAAASLTGANDPQIYDRARAHALALIDPTAQGQANRPPASVNRLHFQSEELDPQGLEVAFAAQIDGPYMPATAPQTMGLAPSSARYARCRYTDAQRPLWMMPVLQALGVDTATTLSVPAQAVAALQPGQEICAMPMTVCTAPGASAAQNYGLTIGQRLTAVQGSSAGYASGRFGWADFTPPQGGASELTRLIEGSGHCGVRIGQAVGQPGQANSIGRAWNTRFGLYAQAQQALQAPPDYTGWGYASGSNNLADYLARRSAHADFQGVVGAGVVKITSADHVRLGQQRRLVTVPLVDCTPWQGGNGQATPPVVDLACVLMLAPIKVSSAPSGAGVAASMDLEFLGLVGQPGAPCATGGTLGGSGGALVPGLVQ